MPSAFVRPCSFPGCRQYAVKGSCYCAEHKRTMNYDGRSRHKLGYTNTWLKARKAFLIAHPLCVECAKLGKTTPATEVDHIIPHKGNKTLFWNEKNWQPLCKSCHSKKTFTETLGKRLQAPEGESKS